MKSLTLALTALAATVVGAPAIAVVTLDQNALVAAPDPTRILIASSSVRNGPSGYDLMQTFTAGLTGTLARIDTQNFTILGPAVAYTLTLYSGNGTVPGTPALGSVSVVVPGGGPVFTTQINVSSLGITVTAGSLYSYEFSAAHTPLSGPASTVGWAIGTAAVGDTDGSSYILNNYSGGRSYRETYIGGVSNGWDLSGNFSTDRGFATYVDVAPVPEPGEWAMMLSGLAIACGTARRRRAD